MPYKTYLNLPFNAIFAESYEYVPIKDNYLMKILLPYIECLYYSRFNVPTFVELYPFNTIRSLEKDDVKFQTLLEKCTMACCTNFCKNRLSSIVSSLDILF